MPQTATSENAKSSVGYLMMGLAVGSILGIFFAPKSGRNTREYLAQKAGKSKEQAEQTVRELRESVAKHKDSIFAAIDAGRHAYRNAKSKAA